jgi:hypothetical protein
VLNLKYFYALAVFSQMLMLLLPLLLFISIVNLPFSEDEIQRYTRVLWKLVVFEICLGLLQLPGRIASGESEDVHGTFTGNAEQYAAFLIIGMFYLIGVAVTQPSKRKKSIAMIVGVLALTISIDNKASWLGLICSMGLVLGRLELLRSRLLKILAPAIFAAVMAAGIYLLATATSGSLTKFSGLAEAVKTGNVKNLGKIKAYFDIAKAYSQSPALALFGAGASNFYSRASQQFYLDAVGLEVMYANPELLQAGALSGDSSRASSSMAGVLSKTMHEPYYMRFYSADEQIFAIGSGQVDTPFSPYAGLLGETGLIGFMLYVSIYATVLRRAWALLNRHETVSEIFPMITATCGFLIYVICNSIYGPFMETTRYSTILWSMLALVFLHKQHSETQSSVDSEKHSLGSDSLHPSGVLAAFQ